MYVPVPALPTQLTKVKTEVSFRAENPWNGNRRGTFQLDHYVVTLRGANSVAEGAYEDPWSGGHHRALRSEEDGILRFLPESLIELWLTKQAPTEALPVLLKQMEPYLKKSDYRPILRSMKIKVLVMVEMVICAALVTIAIVTAVLAQAQWWVAAAVTLGTAGVCWGFLYLLYFGKLFRRKRQMRWLLNRISPDYQPLILHPFDDAQLLPRDRKSKSPPAATAAPSASIPPEQPIQIEPKTPSRQAKPRLPQTRAASQASQAGKPVDLPHLADFESILGSPPPPLPPWDIPHDYSYDTTLSVSSGLEPRRKVILQRDIREFRWQDEAENWGKIRIVGNTLEPFEGVTVSITRKEPPGPFNLRIIVRAAIRPAADAFHKAIIQRIELALYAAAKGSPGVTLSFTKSERTFHPPFFSRESLLYVAREPEPGMALRIKDATPEFTPARSGPRW